MLLEGPQVKVPCLRDKFFSSPTRFSETIPANIFFERCNISESFNAYCNPNDLNFAIEHVYVGCGMIARSSVEQPRQPP